METEQPFMNNENEAYWTTYQAFCLKFAKIHIQDIRITLARRCKQQFVNHYWDNVDGLSIEYQT